MIERNGYNLWIKGINVFEKGWCFEISCVYQGYRCFRWVFWETACPWSLSQICGDTSPLPSTLFPNSSNYYIFDFSSHIAPFPFSNPTSLSLPCIFCRGYWAISLSSCFGVNSLLCVKVHGKFATLFFGAGIESFCQPSFLSFSVLLTSLYSWYPHESVLRKVYFVGDL